MSYCYLESLYSLYCMSRNSSRISWCLNIETWCDKEKLCRSHELCCWLAIPMMTSREGTLSYLITTPHQPMHLCSLSVQITLLTSWCIRKLILIALIISPVLQHFTEFFTVLCYIRFLHYRVDIQQGWWF